MVEWSPHLAAIGQVFFFFSDSRIVSHLPLLDNWQIKLLDSVLVTTHFLSSTCGTSDIRISCNSLELNLAQCMHVVFCVRVVEPKLYVETKWFISFYFDFFSRAHESKERQLWTPHFVPPSPHSSMMISLRGLGVV